jgi:hypothetical protein
MPRGEGTAECVGRWLFPCVWQACTIAGTIIQIEFLQDFGNLPLLQSDSSGLTHAYSQRTPSIRVTTLRDGTKGELPRGRCIVTCALSRTSSLWGERSLWRYQG